MLSRPPSKPIIAMVNPSPSLPRRLTTGTRQSSKMTAAVGCECQPSFSSCLPNERPVAPFSTTRQEMPFGPLSPVRTIAT